MSRQPESLHQDSGNGQTQIFPFGICGNLGNSETVVRQMDSCHSKDTSYKSGTQTSIYEGKELVLGMTQKQIQSRESHKFSEMLIALGVFQKPGQGFDQNSIPERKLYYSFRRGTGVEEQ